MSEPDDRGGRPLPDYVLPLFEEGSAIPGDVRFLVDTDVGAAVIEWIVLPYGVLATLTMVLGGLSGAVMNAVRFGFSPLKSLGFLAIAAPFALLLRVLIRALLGRIHTGRAVRRGDYRYGLFLLPNALVLRRPNDTTFFVRRSDITGVRLQRVRSGNTSFLHVAVDFLPDGLEPASTLLIEGSFRKPVDELKRFVTSWLEEPTEGRGYRGNP